MVDISNLYKIRWMIERDWDQAMAIREQTFESPMTREQWRAMIRCRSTEAMVAESGDGSIMGYVVDDLHREWINLLNMAVDRDHWREGIGDAFIAKLVNKLNAKRRQRIMVQVHEAKLPTQLFFRSMGFKAKGILPAHFRERDGDAYVMEYKYIPARDDVEIPQNRIIGMLS